MRPTLSRCKFLLTLTFFFENYSLYVKLTPLPHFPTLPLFPTKLLTAGYPCLSLHGGKDQVDRDHTLYEFKTGIKTVLVATSVAGRGLDVPEVICVINFHTPNHIEDYVHRVGRTGRAGRKGTAYTFISPQEDHYSSVCIKALERAGVPVPAEVRELHKIYSEKLDRGEAKAIHTNSGFSGKGFTFDAEEMNEQQKIQALQRRAYEKEQGIENPTADDDEMLVADDDLVVGSSSSASGLSSLVSMMLEKAKGIANVISANKSPIFIPVASTQSASSLQPCTLPDGSIDAKAALLRAKSIWAEVLRSRQNGSSVGELDSSSSAHFSEELDINDYPPLARRKITAKATLDDVIERTSVNIIQRGSYVAPNSKKTAEPTDKRLRLLIEGTSEMAVKKAKTEILRLLEEETLKGVGTTGGGGGGAGRYNVL